jgi:CRISPR/Cas system-associated exonuclease Cas4 (RecB family)
MQVFSFSALDMFEKCPRRYYFRYVAGIPEPPSYAAEFGKAVHAVIAGVINTKGAASDLARQAVKKSPLLTEEDAAEVLKLAGRFLGQFRPCGQLYTEYKLLVDLGDGQAFLGYADLIEETDDGLTIVDFKTGRTPCDVFDTKQLALYAWMAAQEFGVSDVKVQLWWLRERKPVREGIATPEIQQDAFGWALNTIGMIQGACELPGWAGFPEMPGTGCAFCPYAANCLQVAVPEGNGTAPEIAGIILRLEALTEQLKERLKQEVEKNGPVEVGGEVFAFHDRATWEFDVRGVVDFLQSLGLDPYDYLNVDGRKLKRLLAGETGEALRSLGTEKITKYFTHKKAGSGAEEAA